MPRLWAHRGICAFRASRPFRVFRRAPFLRQSGVVTETEFLIGLRVLCGLLCICSSSTGYPRKEGQVKHCRCTFFGHATPDRAGARPYRVQCWVARCDMGDRWPARPIAINRQIPGSLVTVIQQRGRSSTRCRRFHLSPFTSHLSPPFASLRGPHSLA